MAKPARSVITIPPTVEPEFATPIATPRRTVNQLAMTNEAGSTVPAEIPTPSSRYAAIIGASASDWLAIRNARPADNPPITITTRASTRSISQPTGRTLIPAEVANTLGRIETR